jgi:hypothetical protein
MPGGAGMGVEATSGTAMGGTEATSGTAMGGTEATSGMEAHGLGLASASGHSGGRIGEDTGGRIGDHTGGDTGGPMPTRGSRSTRTEGSVIQVML